MDENHKWKIKTTANIGWQYGGCSASYDSFVQGSTAVFLFNFCAKFPPLRKAAGTLADTLKNDRANKDS
jgi:hypothetical protein